MRERLNICFVWLFVALMASAGCAESKTHISASDYDQSCERDEECTLVIEGDVCDCGQPAAINFDAEDDFQDDKRRMQQNCTEGCIPEYPLEGVCTSGTCELREIGASPEPDASSDTSSADAG